MFASIRGKKKAARDGAAAAAAAGGGGGGSAAVAGGRSSDQQQKAAPALSLQLPEPLRYYPGTQMPMDGWFHACRLCRCWTAFSATATTGEHVPLCRRCLPAAARKGLSTGKGATRSTQQQQQQAASAAAAPAGPAPSAAAVRSRLPATYAAAGGKPAADAVPASRAVEPPTPAAAKAAATGMHPPAAGQLPAHQAHHDGQQQHQQTQDAVWHFIRQQQQQHKLQQDIGGSITHAHSAPPGHSAAHRPPAFDQQHQAGSLATAATAGAGAVPAYAASCYKHLGPPSNAVAPMPALADHHFITCINEPTSAAAAASGGMAAAGGGGGTQPHTRSSSSAGSDDGVLASITALLSDLYRLSFSGSAAAAAAAAGGSSNGGAADACGGSQQQHGMAVAQGVTTGPADDGSLPI